MAERRSLGDALEMTPEKIAFIEGRKAKEPKLSEVDPPSTKLTIEKSIELESARSDGEASKDPRPRAARRSLRSRSSQESPEASEILDRVLKPRSIRLRHRINQALTRASLERRLGSFEPCAIQDIAEEALIEWLEKAGYLD